MVRTSSWNGHRPIFSPPFSAHQKATAESVNAHAALRLPRCRPVDTGLTKLLGKAQAPTENNDTEKAIRLYSQAAALRKAVERAQESRFCSPVRYLAEFLVHRGDEAAAQEAMTKWFAGEAPCYCCAVLEGDIAARKRQCGGREPSLPKRA